MKMFVLMPTVPMGQRQDFLMSLLLMNIFDVILIVPLNLCPFASDQNLDHFKVVAYHMPYPTHNNNISLCNLTLLFLHAFTIKPSDFSIFYYTVLFSFTPLFLSKVERGRN